MSSFRALLLLIALGVAGASCDGSQPQPAGTTAPSGSVSVTTVPPEPPGTSIQATTASPPVSTTTTSPPVPIVVTDGYWPTGIEALLIADGERIVRVHAAGDAEELLVGSYVAAFDDRRGGIAFVRLDTKDGYQLPTLYWQAEGAEPGFVLRSEQMHPLGVLDIPTLWPGPGFASYAYDTNNIAGDTCVGYMPLRSIDGSFIPMEGSLLCRRPPERLDAAAWSGRYFALVVTAGNESWLEFEGPGGELLPVPRGESMLFTHSPEPVSGATIDAVAIAPGTNLIAYTVAAGSWEAAPTYLVVHDLDTGVELLRTAVANPGVHVTNLDMTATGVVVSRAAVDPVPALMVDIAGGQKGEAPRPGFATIAGRAAGVPALYPPQADGGTDLVVTSPSDHARVEARVLRFEGLTRPGSLVRSGAYDADVDAAGRWSIALTLRPGSNVATFTSVGPDGSSAETSVAVLCRPEPGEPVGLVYEVLESSQVYDVWTSPAQPLHLWAPSGNLLDYVDNIALRVLTGSDPTVSGAGPPEMLWLSDVAYTDRGVTAWTVRDRVVLESDGWVDRCWSLDDPTAAPLVAVMDPTGQPQRAWQVDLESRRLDEIDPAGLDCLMVAG